jgi:hypothetical protein
MSYHSLRNARNRDDKGGGGWKPPWRKIEDVLRYVAAWSFGIFFFLCIVGIPVLLVITTTYGLGDPIRHRAEEMLSGKFYRVSVGRVLFSPLHGFRLDRLQIRDTTPSARLLVTANRLEVSPNMDSLLRRQPHLDKISLRDATLDVPLGPSEEPRLRLDHVRALILWTPEEFNLSSASFDVAGITVNVTGRFLNPKKFSPIPVNSEGPGKTALTIDLIQRELGSIRWEGEGDHPTLSFDAGGDLGDTKSLWINHANFLAGAGSWHGVPFQGIHFSLQYGEQKLALEKFLLDDGGGRLQVAGGADFFTKKGSVEMLGDFNAGIVTKLLFPRDQGTDWQWIDPTRISGSFSMDWNATKLDVKGFAEIASGRFSYKGIKMDRLSAGVSLREDKVLLRDIDAEGDPGKINADLLLAPGDNRLRLKAELFPARLIAATSGKTAEALSSMEFNDPLRINFEGGMPATDPLQINGSGTLNLGKGAMRGSWIDSLNANFQFSAGAASFRDIVVRMGNGMGRGEFIYDYRNWEGRFPKVESTLDPVKLMMWIDPRIADSLRDYRFATPPKLKITGKIGLRNPDKNDLHIALNAPDGLNYTLIGRDLPFGETSGTVVLKGQQLAVDLPRSHLFGGDVAMRADVSVAPGDGRYGASIHLDDVDFKTLTKLYFDYNDSSGKLTADYSFRTVGGDAQSMTGKGNLLIKNGNILAMPILGPLSLLLNDIIPGFGYQSARKASTDFTVDHGVITTRNLLIEGTGFSMIGNGDIYYLDDTMNMNIRLNAQGLPGVVLFPVSKILEYESVGSAKHPKWRPKILPGHSAKPPASAKPTPS